MENNFDFEEMMSQVFGNKKFTSTGDKKLDKAINEVVALNEKVQAIGK